MKVGAISGELGHSEALMRLNRLTEGPSIAKIGRKVQGTSYRTSRLLHSRSYHSRQDQARHSQFRRRLNLHREHRKPTEAEQVGNHSRIRRFEVRSIAHCESW